jgi:eukaryotic-like serine/threonine-protein kinase
VTASKGSVRLVQDDQRRFGELDLLAKLGHGGMADVFLAAPRNKPSELVVLKRLKEDLLDAEHRSMFEDEARIMPQLSHPNVVRTIEYGSQEGWPYLAMEFLDGLPLDQCAGAVAALGAVAVRHVVCELLEGLHYAHELRSSEGQPLEIVHRDVSPHNVFITYDGRVTLVDFGIAKSKGRAQHTTTGVVRGKLAYMAPEQALCEVVDRRADLFAVAVVAFELLTGKRFWEGQSEVQILKRMTFGDLPKIASAVPPETPPQLVEVLTKALAARPEDRQATARELRDELSSAVPGVQRRMALGAAVADLAKEARAELRTVVDDYLAHARGTVGLVGIDPLAESGERSALRLADPGPVSSRRVQVEATEAREKDAARHEDGAGPSAAAAHLENSEITSTLGTGISRDSPREPRSRLLGVVVGIGVAVAAAASLAVFTGREPARPEVPAGPTQPEHVEVKIGATREGTRVFIDNAPIDALPYEGRFPRDGASHTIRAEAPGHVGESKIVVFNRNVDIVFTLLPERPQAPVEPTATTATAATPAGQPRAPGASARPSVSPATTPRSTNGGFDYQTPPWGAKPPRR